MAARPSFTLQNSQGHGKKVFFLFIYNLGMRPQKGSPVMLECILCTVLTHAYILWLLNKLNTIKLRSISVVHVKFSICLEKPVQPTTFTKSGIRLFFDYLRDISFFRGNYCYGFNVSKINITEIQRKWLGNFSVM
jgi:hypothetical protein